MIGPGTYTVEKHTHGVVIRGGVPASIAAALFEAYDREGYTLLVPGIASALEANFAIVRDEADVEAWRAAIAADVQKVHGSNAEANWLYGTDTGLSSLVIFQCLCSDEHRRAVDARLRHYQGSYPHDPSDFGRCHRLLEALPSWRSRLPEVAERHPDGPWPALVRTWPELESLWLEEEPSGVAPMLYARMREIIAGSASDLVVVE